jgi:3-oxoacyl-[acyl-carrier protein] reductase
MFDLTDRTALVTGATGGIGAAIARTMHAKGAVIAISGRTRSTGAAVCRSWIANPAQPPAPVRNPDGPFWAIRSPDPYNA